MVTHGFVGRLIGFAILAGLVSFVSSASVSATDKDQEFRKILDLSHTKFITVREVPPPVYVAPTPQSDADRAKILDEKAGRKLDKAIELDIHRNILK